MFKTIKNIFNYYQCNKNYKKKLEELCSKEGKIKVCFLIRENQKWSYQSLYELLVKSEEFEPVVLVSLLWLSHIGKDTTRKNLEENYNFFKEKGMNVQFAYENGQYVDLSKFNPDIIFYDQPWDLPEIHKPETVSQFALTCYAPYGFGILNVKSDYTKEFHKLLFKYFVNNELMLKTFKNKASNCIVTGNPKYDVYLEKENNKETLWKNNNAIKIIYAPHHSLDKKGLKLATFKENGKFILEYARNHKETTWIFKPHPRFKYALLRNNVMTLEEIEKYYKAWNEVGHICEGGDYFKYFKTSDLLITDCCSFLGEYFPTSKPIIRLSTETKPPFNEIGKLIDNYSYTAKTNEELKSHLTNLISKNFDNKKSLRENAVPKILNLTNKSSEKIYYYLKKATKVKGNKND